MRFVVANSIIRGFVLVIVTTQARYVGQTGNGSLAESDHLPHQHRAYGVEQFSPGKVEEEASEVKESTPVETGIEPLVRKFSESSDNVKARYGFY